MKWIERTFLVCNVLAFTVCSLRVPWYYRNPLGVYYRRGYSWLWKPPEIVAAPDLSATILQVAACALVSGAVFFLIVRWKRT